MNDTILNERELDHVVGGDKTIPFVGAKLSAQGNVATGGGSGPGIGGGDKGTLNVVLLALLILL